MHPQGGPVPDGAAPANVQVVMLDGSWGETSAMAREIVSWGRTVSLPMAGASRYWLRAQQDGGRFSTVEALMFLLHRFGLMAAHDALREQFELHVYASLRSRGRKESAAEFLAGSMIGTFIGQTMRGNHDYASGWLMSIIGAMVLLGLHRMMFGRK